MTDGDNSRNDVTSVDDNESIRHMKRAVIEGKPWHIALLEAIALWTWPEEEHKGHRYRYLIDGEAFDWLLLAERLAKEVAGAIPEGELVNLLFFGRLPGEISDEVFRELIGPAKYHAYLNYLYGVVIEKFVLLAVEEEIRKERHSRIFSGRDDGQDDSYMRVYGAGQEALLKLFRQGKGYLEGADMPLQRLHEFTYWLFKYRIENCDKERVASDTRKGIEYLRKYL
ncbi:MAG: hypothetical protein MUP21_11450 [Dehalococcoidia bacterium]|nr:hypothetical protein [Dehalococcoidia bacterium]